jgi:HK97 gp10 family phage protein
VKTTVRVDGLRELDAALGALAEEYGKAAGKAVLRRVADQALQPMAEAARQLAPDDPDTQGRDLRASIAVGGKLTKRQAAIARKDQNKATVTRYMGTADVAGVPQEFGTVNHGPQAFMRPAFDQHALGAIDIVAKELGPEIEKTAARIAKRRAAKAAKAAGAG